MRRILITGGPTNEPIDEVMKITNMSTGSFSVELTRRALEEGCFVCLIANDSVIRGGLFEKYRLSEAKNLKIISIECTEDMLHALEKEAVIHAETPYDIILHTSAVGDYKADFTFRMEDMAKELAASLMLHRDASQTELESICLNIMRNPDCKVNSDSKISSYEPSLTVKLGLTTKLIARLRTGYPGAVLIGCKLLENVTKEHLIEVAQKLCMKNDMDFILANDLAVLRSGWMTRHLVSSEGYTGLTFNSPDSNLDLLDYAAEHWFR